MFIFLVGSRRTDAGLVNLGVLGTLVYFTYMQWDGPSFMKKNLSFAIIGLITLSRGLGYIVEKYRRDHLRKYDYARMKGSVEGGYDKVKGGAKNEFVKGLKTIEDEFGPLGGVKRNSEAERVDIAVGWLEKKKEKAGVHPT
jgi:hypothetical protein